MPIAEAHVLAMIDSLGGRMKIRRRVALRESPEVDTAMTGGWLRPFVLLPPGMAATLGSEIEPVLAHELAHVRRRDFAVAVLQAIADAGTRLSPGHRWLSLEASRLREQACDDVVVTLGVEPLRYARALEALGQWGRGVQVTNVVCAANRHLAARVRRLLEGPRKPRVLAVVSAVILLCGGGLGTALVVATAPGLPMPPSGRRDATVSPTLIAGRDEAQTGRRRFGTTVDYHYNPESPSAPFRIPSMAIGVDTVTATIQSVYPKRIIALALGMEAHRVPTSTPEDRLVARSSLARVAIDPGQSASSSFTFIAISETRMIHGGRVQARYYPAYAKFEDGTEWSGGPPSEARLTIPRALVSFSAPEQSVASEKIWHCFDAEGHDTSEGGIAQIREDEGSWVRCTNGRWVPTRSPVPLVRR
jgi:hypothetical protein